MTAEKVAHNVGSLLVRNEVDPDFKFPDTVDDVSPEEPGLSMGNASYSEIFSTRISYGSSEIYDIFVARVK